jgi:hypothetical protein
MGFHGKKYLKLLMVNMRTEPALRNVIIDTVTRVTIVTAREVHAE